MREHSETQGGGFGGRFITRPNAGLLALREFRHIYVPGWMERGVRCGDVNEDDLTAIVVASERAHLVAVELWSQKLQGATVTLAFTLVVGS